MFPTQNIWYYLTEERLHVAVEPTQKSVDRIRPFVCPFQNKLSEPLVKYCGINLLASNTKGHFLDPHMSIFSSSIIEHYHTIWYSSDSGMNGLVKAVSLM